MFGLPPRIPRPKHIHSASLFSRGMRPTVVRSTRHVENIMIFAAPRGARHVAGREFNVTEMGPIRTENHDPARGVDGNPQVAFRAAAVSAIPDPRRTDGFWKYTYSATMPSGAPTDHSRLSTKMRRLEISPVSRSKSKA